MESGTIAKWMVKEGDSVAPGSVLALVETDKASVDYESQEDGFIAKILVEEGASDLEIGTPLAVMVENEEDIAAFANFTAADAGGSADAPSASAPEPAPAPAPAEAPAPAPAPAPAQAPAPSPAAAESGDRLFISPLARATAQARGIDLASLHGRGTGPNGRVIEADVLEFQPVDTASANAAEDTSGAAAQTAADGRAFTDVPVSGVRGVIARRLTESKQTVPHYYLTVDVELDEVLRLRGELNAAAAEGAPRLSVNDFLIRASALAMRDVPEVNASWLGDVVRHHHFVDVSVAVSTDAGLITPIVKDADRKGLAAISADVKDLAARARDRKLAPEEFQGGTFTISNLGMFGVSQFAAIINPPQSAILAVGAAERRVLPVEGSVADGEEAYRFATGLTATLSCDHRVVDGAVGAQWLKAFKQYLEKPMTMLL